LEKSRRLLKEANWKTVESSVALHSALVNAEDSGKEMENARLLGKHSTVSRVGLGSGFALALSGCGSGFALALSGRGSGFELALSGSFTSITA